MYRPEVNKALKITAYLNSEKMDDASKLFLAKRLLEIFFEHFEYQNHEKTSNHLDGLLNSATGFEKEGECIVGSPDGKTHFNTNIKLQDCMEEI